MASPPFVIPLGFRPWFRKGEGADGGVGALARQMVRSLAEGVESNPERKRQDEPVALRRRCSRNGLSMH